MKAVAWALRTITSSFCVWHGLPAWCAALKGAFTDPAHLSTARKAVLAAGGATLKQLLDAEEEECGEALGALMLVTNKDLLAAGIDGMVRKYGHVPGVVSTLSRPPYRSINALCMALNPDADSVNWACEPTWVSCAWRHYLAPPTTLLRDSLSSFSSFSCTPIFPRRRTCATWSAGSAAPRTAPRSR